MFPLFHQLIKRVKKLVHGFVVSGFDIVGNAGSDVVAQQFTVKGVECRTGRRGLNKNFRTVCIIFDHAADSADLPFDAVQAVNQPFVFGFVALFFFVTKAFLFHNYIVNLPVTLIS